MGVLFGEPYHVKAARERVSFDARMARMRADGKARQQDAEIEELRKRVNELEKK